MIHIGFSFLATAAIMVAALYPTIAFHELAHSTAAFMLDCKANWYETDMSPFLYRSFGGDIDYGCLRNKGAYALAIVDGAGPIS